jgi:acetyl esterase/lipase
VPPTRLRCVFSDRLAPEFQHPSAFNDVLAVTRYLCTQKGIRIGMAGKEDPRIPLLVHVQALYAMDPNLSAIGDSAGGNLVAAVTNRLSSEGYRLAAQLLFYPATDMTSSTVRLISFLDWRDSCSTGVLTTVRPPPSPPRLLQLSACRSHTDLLRRGTS